MSTTTEPTNAQPSTSDVAQESSSRTPAEMVCPTDGQILSEYHRGEHDRFECPVCNQLWSDQEVLV